MTKRERIDAIVDARLKAGNYRHSIANLVPRGSSRIMEYGFGDGSLLLGLKRDRKCRGMYGIEINPAAAEKVDGLLTKTWLTDLNEHDAWLEPEYEGFFNYILAPMSLEHTYDPWYVLKKFNKFLAKDGKVIVEVPNVQHWACLYYIFTGDFPYVSGGTWDYTHIRWYTVKSLIDIAFVAGFGIDGYLPQYAKDVNPRDVEKTGEAKTLSLPPTEVNSNLPPIEITLPFDIKSIYHMFLAQSLILILKKAREPEDFDPTPAGMYLEAYRLNTPTAFPEVSMCIAPPFVPSLIPRIKDKAEKLREELMEKHPGKEG